jgi:hypothetical protein
MHVLSSSLAAVALLLPAGGEPRPPLEPNQLDALHRLIKPAPGEARWAEVPWAPAADLWAARQKAAREGKPLFLWYMAGEPLGQC